MSPLLIAHRGDTVHFPENTIEAFAGAFGRGADGIELDIHSHNGALVVVHNYLFDRRKSYPTLDEVLEKFAGKGRIEIEIKALDLDFLPLLVSLITRYRGADLEVTTSVQPLVRYVARNYRRYDLV